MVSTSKRVTNRRAVRRSQRRAQPVMALALPQPPRRRRRPRRQPRNQIRGASRDTFVLAKDSINGNSTGSVTFGPSLTESAALVGILKAYHEYRITSIRIQYVSEASSTSSGSIAHELDAHCRLTALSSSILKFPITKSGTVSYDRNKIRGTEWHDTSNDQFRFHYKGNGASSIAGSWKFTFTVEFQSPK